MLNCDNDGMFYDVGACPVQHRALLIPALLPAMELQADASTMVTLDPRHVVDRKSYFGFSDRSKIFMAGPKYGPQAGKSKI